MKNKRHNVILSIIDNKDIETQEELIDCLRSEGFGVTQATVSRDIRELKLTKVTGENGRYKYVRPASNETNGQQLYKSTISGSVISIEYSMNLVVIRTYPGMAQAVAAGIDSHKISGIMGCVAGDDTIFVAVKTVEGAKNAAKDIKRIISG